MAALAYVLVLALVALGVPLALSLRDRVEGEVAAQARSQAGILAATAPPSVDPPRERELRRLVETAGEQVRGRVIVVDADGIALADSAGDDRVGADYSRRPEIAQALRGSEFQGERHSGTLGESLLVTAEPVVDGNEVVGAVRVTQSIEAVERALDRSTGSLVVIGLVVLALGLAAGALIAAQLARPIRRLEEAVREVEGGALDARAPVGGTREQQALAGAFNSMTARLEAMLDSQRQFVADASHQLRTPLTGLRLRLEEARAVSGDPAAQAELEAAEREVDRLAGIVEELLVLSRAGERDAPATEVDLRDVAAAAVARWEAAAAGGRRSIELDAGPAPALARCARADADRALDVLVENALGYSPAGAHVVVRVRRGTIEVLDDGPGLAPGEEGEVFARFHRGSAARNGVPGSGLGLAIVRELAGGWGGAATIENRPAGGACARLSFAGPLPGTS